MAFLSPEKSIGSVGAPNQPEQTLAGIRPRHMRIESVISRLGQPLRVENFPADHCDPQLCGGERRYFWTAGGETTEVGVLYTGPKSGSKPTIYFVAVSGDCVSKHLCQTGKGVGLGDSVRRVRQIYASAHPKVLPSTDGSLLEIAWESKELGETRILRITVNQLKVTEMKLIFAED